MQEVEIDPYVKEELDALKYVLSEPSRWYSFVKHRYGGDKGEIIEVRGDELEEWQLKILLGECHVRASKKGINLHVLEYDRLSKNIDNLLEDVFKLKINV